MIGLKKPPENDRAIAVPLPSPMVWLERCLLIAGLAGILYCGSVGARMFAAHFDAEQISTPQRAIDAEPSAAERPDSGPQVSPFAAAEGEGARPAVVGRVEIPAIGLMSPLLAGDDSMSLSEGAGHIPGTALPGGLGTVGIAGHRDTHFRLLAKAKPGMEVRLVTREGVYRYRIISSEIVTPEQVSVLDIGQVPGLALVTCYPFQFVGHAKMRFIVHANLISLLPDASGAASR